jgi:hypothetical protein
MNIVDTRFRNKIRDFFFFFSEDFLVVYIAKEMTEKFSTNMIIDE